MDINKYKLKAEKYRDKYRDKYIGKEETVEVKSNKKLSFREFVNEVYTRDKGFDDLFEFQFEMAEWFLNQTNTSLVLATRQIGKSRVLTVLTSLYRIYLNPYIRIGIMSARLDTSRERIGIMNKIIETNKEFFNDIIDCENLLANKIKTKVTVDYTVYAGSVDTSIRGKGFNHVIFDDLVDEKTSIYELARLKAKECYEEIQRVCKDKEGIKHSIQFIGNITHPLDLHSELRMIDSIPRFEIYADDYRIPDMFKPNLDKERITSSESNIQRNYFGVLLPDENLPFYDVRVISQGEIDFQQSTPYIFYDFSQGKNDLSCYSLCWQVGYQIYVYGYAIKEDWDMFVQRTSQDIKRFKYIFFESNTSGEDMGIRKFKQQGINAMPVHTTTNKKEKIQALYPLRNNIILVSDGSKENKNYIEQLKAYTPLNNRSGDDSVDSLSMCLIQMGIINTRG
jgi:hypothetical protein